MDGKQQGEVQALAAMAEATDGPNIHFERRLVLLSARASGGSVSV